MKNVLLIWIAAVCLAACQSSDKNGETELSYEERLKASADSSKFTTIQWLDSMSRDLGKEQEGKKVEILYRFKNTGKHNLILKDVTPSCGCTTPEWPKQAIPPGEEGMIKAVFDSKGRVGPQHKDIQVMANTRPESSMRLTFSVEIIK
jgi:hypothetical protein